jgi:hypothetical protein
MKEFLYLRNGLRSLQPSTRFAYTLFLVFSLASYGVMIALAAGRSGFSPASVGDYYAGGGDRYAKTAGELLELTHFHLFSVPLLLFVQGHLFLMTRWPQSLKKWIVIAAFTGAALDLAGPWLIVYVSRSFWVAKLAARVLLGPSLLLFTIVPLVEMWRPAPGESPAEGEKPPRLGEE